MALNTLSRDNLEMLITFSTYLSYKETTMDKEIKL